MAQFQRAAEDANRVADAEGHAGPDEEGARDAELLEALRREFPDWNIIHTTDTDRWWAIRRPEPKRRSSVVTELEADTAEALAELLRETAAVEAGR